jgi:hypothetical protein
MSFVMADDLERGSDSVAYVLGGVLGRRAVTRSRDFSLTTRPLDFSLTTRSLDLSRDFSLTPRSLNLSRDFSLDRSLASIRSPELWRRFVLRSLGDASRARFAGAL